MQAAKTKVEDGMAYTIKEGDYRQYGASAAGGGVVFTFEAEKEEDCSILLYGKDGGIRKELKVPESCCRGAIRSVFVAGLKAESLRYNYKISGTVVTDPYAKRIIGRERWRDAGRVKNEFRVCGGYSDDTFSWGRMYIRRSRAMRCSSINSTSADFRWMRESLQRSGGLLRRCAIRFPI